VKAVRYHRYGPPEVLQVEDVPDPVPGDGEVLVRVHATTVNRTDCGFRRPDPFFVRVFSGLRRPRHPTLGSEFAGTIEAIGPRVDTLAVGDEVFGVNADRFGAHAELLCMPADGPIAPKPPMLSFDEAAAVCDGVVLARTCLQKARLRAGQRVLVYGASGSIGSAGVQLAKHFGAYVTAVCGTPNLEVVRSLGADEVIDYLQTDFADREERYDVVFDAVGKTSFWHSRRVIARRGQFVVTDFGPHGLNPLLALVTRLTALVGTRRVRLPIPRYSQAHVQFLADLVEQGRYRALIDRRYPLEDVVAATAYVETGQKVGNVVLQVR
jgi:NADPH:quinone reductase-like Zn-dependent oxidoreductase